MFDRFIKKYSLGVDISDSGVKMLALEREGKRIAVTGWAEGAFPSGAHSDGRIIDAAACLVVIEKATQSMKRVLKRNATTVVASVSDIHTQIATFVLPKNTLNEEAVLAEATNHIPIDRENTIIDWQPIGENGDTVNVFVITVPKDVSNAITEILEKVDLFPSVIESEATALARLFSDKEEHVIIDCGQYRTMFLVVRNDIPLFTIALPLAGHTLTETIARTLQLPLPEAEETKRRCGFDDTACTGALREVVREHIEQAIQKITTGLEDIATKNAKTPTAITLVGGGAHLKNIDAVLAKALGIPVTRGVVWKMIPEPKGLPEPTLAWAVALGLALRGIIE